MNHKTFKQHKKASRNSMNNRCELSDSPLASCTNPAIRQIGNENTSIEERTYLENTPLEYTTYFHASFVLDSRHDGRSLAFFNIIA